MKNKRRDFKLESKYWTNYGGTIFELTIHTMNYKFNLQEAPILTLNDFLIGEGYKTFPL